MVLTVINVASDPVKQRKTKSAREYYTAAKDLDPRHAKPHFQLGVLSSEQQRHFEAIIHYIRAASVDKAGGQSTTMSLNKGKFGTPLYTPLYLVDHLREKIGLKTIFGWSLRSSNAFFRRGLLDRLRCKINPISFLFCKYF